ncbi:hypothetical protein HMPREF0063_11092 [Aeromicrobium marinum DSM 15272]|uniref:Cytochrome c oxidase polypeptide 4 n=1 Tax=Aeromicrobium marinum DSM 15272 TaxID=585531 RepID=E2SAN4_9ACTN|nr:cytochrome c oxidase subunit 4 [Aeromicrobium marinum]EFQ83430.1 hypothetical protein HMPREF0063_11092 [Aeromicrobium marinum DSM 15272]
MKNELWTIAFCGVFFVLISPVYWILTGDPTGTTALIMTTLLCVVLGFYLAIVARQIPDRPEDRSDGEIAEGAGELGFFPPYSWWPLYCALAFGVVVLGIIFGWWLFAIGVVFGGAALVGWTFEYYRGIHAH